MAASLALIQKILAVWDPYGHYSLTDWQEAQEQAAAWSAEQTAEPEVALRRLGFVIEYKSLSVPGLWVWGRVVSTERRVYLDREALTFLYETGAAWPEKPSGTDWPIKLVLAHELFHILVSMHTIEHSELAAIIFAFNCLGH